MPCGRNWDHFILQGLNGFMCVCVDELVAGLFMVNLCFLKT